MCNRHTLTMAPPSRRRLAVLACSAALAWFPDPGVARESDGGSDSGYLALCHLNAEGSLQRSPVLLQLGALVDEELTPGDYRIFDRDAVLQGLYPKRRRAMLRVCP